MTHSIALVGTSGAGKTTIGRLLAERFGVDFVDVDAEIERRTGLEIRQIFAYHGEKHFRDLERDVTVDALARPGIVSLGGGAPMTRGVAEALRSHRNVVWLQVDPQEAALRIGNDPHRPLLGDGDIADKLTAMLAVRGPVYADVCSIAIDTTAHSRAEVLDAVAAHVRAAVDAVGVDLA